MRMLAVVAVAVLSAAAAHAGSERREIVSGGVEREYILFTPEAGQGPRPLVILFHGGGSSARGMQRFADFDGAAERFGFAVAYPDGLDHHWNDGRDEDDPRRGRSRDADDVRFTVDLIDALAREGVADPARVFLVGISNGGMMSLRAGCLGADRIAGIAVVAASQPENWTCAPGRPLPALFIHGTDDEFIPFEGGPVAEGKTRHDLGRVLSAAATLDMFRGINGCGQASMSGILDSHPSDGTRALVYGYACPPGSTLRHIVIEGGGHTWPGNGQRFLADWILGTSSNEVNASEEIASFFASLPPR